MHNVEGSYSRPDHVDHGDDDDGDHGDVDNYDDCKNGKDDSMSHPLTSPPLDWIMDMSLTKSC